MLFPSAKLIGRGGGLDVDKVFATTLIAGDGTAKSFTTGLDRNQGVLLWLKRRSLSSDHYLIDTARGSNSRLSSNKTDAAIGVTEEAIDPLGFSLTANSLFSGGSTSSVGWSFRRAKKFFDIVTYTGNGVAGRQIPHGLGVKPGMIVVKRIDSPNEWGCYHRDRQATRALLLNSSGADFTSAMWNNTEPTDATFTVGSAEVTNGSGGQYVAYLFAHDPSSSGIIQCGQYTGNGSATGPVVTLGWEPQFLLVKDTSGTGDWLIRDSKRSSANPRTSSLFPNLNNGESGAGLYGVNFLQTGFQPAANHESQNTNGRNYTYLAIRKGKA